MTVLKLLQEIVDLRKAMLDSLISLQGCGVVASNRVAEVRVQYLEAQLEVAKYLEDNDEEVAVYCPSCRNPVHISRLGSTGS